MQRLLLKLDFIQAVMRGENAAAEDLLMKVLITGANGFIGKNLVVYLGERGWTDITTFVRGEPVDALTAKVAHADFIFHLAGINRPKSDTEFFEGNVDLTRALCAAVESSRRKIPLAYASSIQVDRD